MQLLIVLMVVVIASSADDHQSGRRCGWNMDGLGQEVETASSALHRAVQFGDGDTIVELRKIDGPIKDRRVTQ